MQENLMLERSALLTSEALCQVTRKVPKLHNLNHRHQTTRSRDAFDQLFLCRSLVSLSLFEIGLSFDS